MRRSVLVSLLLVLGTVAAYWPIQEAGFLNFDDNQYVTNNPKVFHGLTGEGVAWAFSSFHACNWHPLTWLSHMLDCQVFGDNPAGHHWVNVALHAANAVLLFLLLRRITGATGRSAFVAALFALHPLHVGSVAWISERKDVLSTFFGLLALHAYASRFTDRGSRFTPRASLEYFLSLALFALSLLSKPMLVTLPFLLLLLDYWPFQRPRSPVKPLLLEKIPFLLLAVASAVVTFYAQKSGGAVVRTENVPIEARLENACISYIWYLTKTFWPTGLGPYHPYPTELFLLPAIGAGLSLILLSFGVIRLRKRAPYLVTGWLWYLLALVPVIGLVQVGSQAVADRYTYLPIVGLFIIVVWGVADLTRPWRFGRAILLGVGSFVLVACIIGSTLEVGYWRNSIILFARVLATSPENNALGYHNLAHALSLAGNQRDAIPRFREAVRLHPDFAVAELNWGNSLGVQGKLDPAITHYRQAIRCMPDYEQAYYQLANALALQLKLDEARTNFFTALRFKPDYAEAHTKLGNLLLLQADPEQAMRHLREAIRLRPDYEEGQYYLGAALARQKEFPVAVACFRAAIKARPRYPGALNDLAWILATAPDPRLRNPQEALGLAERACQFTGFRDPGYLDTLAVAQSELGNLSEAARLTENAVALASAAGDAVLASQLQIHLASYRAGHSYTSRIQPPPAPAIP